MPKPRIPAHLKAHTLWTDQEEGADGGMIVYATERWRRTVGVVIALSGFVFAAALILVKAPPPIALAAAVVVIAGGRYALGGKAGFYAVQKDGELGDFLGRSRPDLSHMRRTRLR
jgi:hypothetical protein